VCRRERVGSVDLDEHASVGRVLEPSIVPCFAWLQVMYLIKPSIVPSFTCQHLTI
jgi:hypothetical protein